jgi:adenylate cyclase
VGDRSTRVGDLWGFLLSFGSHPDEENDRRGRRRIFVGALWFSLPFLMVFSIAGAVREGRIWVAVVLWSIAAVNLTVLLAIKVYPRSYESIIQAAFFANVVGSATITIFEGGLIPSGVNNAWGLVSVLGAIVAVGIRSALFWFGAWIVTLVSTAVLPRWIEPLYPGPVSTETVVFSFIGLTVLIFAVMIYFVRQRDRFQKQSDDLLHNILPDEIADQLKQEQGMIADYYPSASVLFADVVDFTPLSSSLAPKELVGLLDEVFKDLDRLVSGAGLEKIKTIGDEYMVAAGVPVERTDHAEAICGLALDIHRLMSTKQYRGQRLVFRIGINSGPVVAGIIGEDKFTYDLWGDTVNTASRMETHGVGGATQISPSTHSMIADLFVCERRGSIEVKGKGPIDTWLLIDRKTGH